MIETHFTRRIEEHGCAGLGRVYRPIRQAIVAEPMNPAPNAAMPSKSARLPLEKFVDGVREALESGSL